MFNGTHRSGILICGNYKVPSLSLGRSAACVPKQGDDIPGTVACRELWMPVNPWMVPKPHLQLFFNNNKFWIDARLHLDIRWMPGAVSCRELWMLGVNTYDTHWLPPIVVSHYYLCLDAHLYYRDPLIAEGNSRLPLHITGPRPQLCPPSPYARHCPTKRKVPRKTKSQRLTSTDVT